jgi:hypothetical protein
VVKLHLNRKMTPPGSHRRPVDLAGLFVYVKRLPSMPYRRDHEQAVRLHVRSELTPPGSHRRPVDLAGLFVYVKRLPSMPYRRDHERAVCLHVRSELIPPGSLKNQPHTYKKCRWFIFLHQGFAP